MDRTDDLICAFVFDERGSARSLDWKGVRAHRPQDGWLWIHLQREAPTSRDWLVRESGLDDVLCDALLSSESRPRCDSYGDGLLVSLRGVNLNPGADPEDMVALVLWAEAGRVISVRRRRLVAIDALRASIDAGHGPASPGEFLAGVADGLVERIGPVVDSLEEEIADVEEGLLDDTPEDLRAKLAELRRTAIALRRYISPQREAMSRLLGQQAAWVSAADRRWLREVADRITRYVEDLDAVRERAQIVQEEMAARLSQQLNRNMYVLSVVAALFLPLGLLTGYLGINVGGIPGAQWRWSFAVVGAALALIGAAELWILRRLRFI